MKKLFATVLTSFIVATTTATFAPDAEAKRLGGGTSSGMKRDNSVMRRDATPPPAQNAAAARPGQAAAAPASGASRWLGPLAGLAAGIGLAALLSHFGLGEGMANILMIALLVMAAVMAFKFFFRKKEAAAGMQYAGAGAAYTGPGRVEPSQFEGSNSGVSAGSTVAGSMAATGAANIPADFDVDGFVRQAKLNYIRLQAANDRGDMDDIRNFTTPEMFADIQMQYQERGRDKQETDVQQLDATVLDVAEEAGRHVVSVRFYGRVREEAGGPVETLDEVWHMAKPLSGSGGWVIAGIQQFQ